MFSFRNLRKFSNYFKSTQRTYMKSQQIPALTHERYKVKRGNYSNLTDSDITFFENLLGRSHILTDSDDIQGYNIDFLGSVRGNSNVVLKPKSTEEISAILKYCNERKLAVCPQGGNTGLVGGSVPVFDEIILSLEQLNKIETIDEMSGIVTCESGCILENLEEAAEKHQLCLPLDLGAKSSCHIGGNVSTNAGGLRLIRYGNLHGSVVGLKAVLANGTVLDLMSNFKKDNTGYHLKHLFIGSEGTLGVITKLNIHCPPTSKSVHVAFLGLPTFEAVLNTFSCAKHELGEILSSCEMIDKQSFQCSINNYNLHSPIGDYQFYMLIESSGSNFEHDEDKFNKFLTNMMGKGYVIDGTFSSEPSKVKQIWNIREFIPTALIKDGFCFKYDISLPLCQFYDIVHATRDRAADLAVRVCGYGHLGDCNLHLNVSCRKYSKELHQRIEPFIYEYTSDLGGSISAEHGIGFLKSQYLKFSKSAEAIRMMKDVKLLMDPNCILNPYKVIL